MKDKDLQWILLAVTVISVAVTIGTIVLKSAACQ